MLISYILILLDFIMIYDISQHNSTIMGGKYMYTLYNNIKYLTDKSGITIKELEERIGFSNGQIGKWKQTSPSIYKVKAVADYFNVTLDSLVSNKVYTDFSKKEVSTFDLNYIKEYSSLSDHEQDNLKKELIEYLKYQVYKMKKL